MWGLTLLKIDLEGKGQGDLGLMSVILSSQRFPLVKELKNILIGPFEIVFYQRAIHSVKLTKIFGVESMSSSSPPNQKLLPTPLDMTCTVLKAM